MEVYLNDCVPYVVAGRQVVSSSLHIMLATPPHFFSMFLKGLLPLEPIFSKTLLIAKVIDEKGVSHHKAVVEGQGHGARNPLRKHRGV